MERVAESLSRRLHREPAGSPALPGTLATEPHFTPEELAERWGLSPQSIRRLFRDEPGVLKLGQHGRRDTRDYVSLRIPESVARRVHQERSR